jgi:protein SCO1/2
MSKPKLISIFSVFLITILSYSQTSRSLFDQQMQVGFDEKQGQYVALDVQIVNEGGDTVLLRDILTKPTILNLVYFNCPGTCSPLMWGVSKFIDGVDLNLGDDYEVFTVSFDPSEKIELGIKKKASYISTMTKKESAQNWHFFVTDSLNIAKLTQSVGFNYRKVNGQYVHPTGLIALAPDGKIVRYLRGIEFLPFDIKITMIEAADGKIGPSINRLLAVCYSYDDQKNNFVFNVTRVSAIVISFIAILFFLFLVLTRIKSKNKASK